MAADPIRYTQASQKMTLHKIQVENSSFPSMQAWSNGNFASTLRPFSFFWGEVRKRRFIQGQAFYAAKQKHKSSMRSICCVYKIKRHQNIKRTGSWTWCCYFQSFEFAIDSFFSSHKCQAAISVIPGKWNPEFEDDVLFPSLLIVVAISYTVQAISLDVCVFFRVCSLWMAPDKMSCSIQCQTSFSWRRFVFSMMNLLSIMNHPSYRGIFPK